MVDKPTQQEVKVAFPESLRGGVYSNNMVITHTREEFVLDFMMITPPMGSITARVILSPGHTKRMLSALKANLEKYESRFGKVTEASAPPKPQSEQEKAFAILDLEPQADATEIKARYIKLVKQLHPDANGGDPEAEERLKTVNQAYTTLKNGHF